MYLLINNQNQKIYVGVTKKTLQQRFDNGNGYKKCVRLWEDIQKYGFDSFDGFVFRDRMERNEAYKLEEKMVDMLGTLDPEIGYNMRRGGIHNVPCKEVCMHISESKMGHVVTPETRAKLSRYGAINVIQLSLDNNPLRIFDSITDAANSVGVHKNNIWAVCNGKKKTCKRYKWMYLDKWNDAKKAEEKDRVKHM